MIEFALEIYPIRHVLTNGIQSMIRPLRGDDAPAFTLFHEAVPDLERFLIKHRLSDTSQIQAWCHDLDVLMGLNLSVDFENTGGGD